jgi:hypothetical protein
MEAGHFAPDAGAGARKALCNRRSLGEETSLYSWGESKGRGDFNFLRTKTIAKN